MPPLLSLVVFLSPYGPYFYPSLFTSPNTPFFSANSSLQNPTHNTHFGFHNPLFQGCSVLGFVLRG
ncbi:hypothetical protein AKJ16_DCAP09675 [Drosera capensis]